MDISELKRPLSEAEKAYVNEEAKNALGEQFHSILNFAIVPSCILSFIILLNFYDNVNIDILISWYILFNIIIFLMGYINVSYKKANNHQRIFAYSVVLIITAILWPVPLYFPTDNLTRQYVMSGILLIIAVGYMQSTIGLFALSAFCTTLILGPLIVWYLLQNNLFGYILAIFTLIYHICLISISHKNSLLLRKTLALKTENKLYAYLANNDLITDLPNQQLINYHIEKMIKNAKQTNQNFAVICFAINRLEHINNTMGYFAGDLLMNATSKRLQSLLAELTHRDNIERILSRPRSDAFVILINPIDIGSIEKEVKQLFLSLEAPFQLQNKESHPTASAGVTIFPKDSTDGENLLTNTYAAMFESKLKGGNQVTYYKSEILSKAPVLLELETDLKHAIKKKELDAYYQPLLDLQNGLICGAEALLRWRHPKLGVIPAADFLPLAEETGLILPMGVWILEEAFKQATLWHKQGFDNLTISINLSHKQLRQNDLIKTIDKAIEDTGVDTQKIELELTETTMLDDKLLPLITEISQKGISLVIDNFGTGYSGLRYLKHFQIKKIKIDKSFIADIMRNSDSAMIVAAIMAMAKELNIKTLAEGVETREQLDVLRNKGCQFVQGYYISKPLTGIAFEALLKKGVSEKL